MIKVLIIVIILICAFILVTFRYKNKYLKGVDKSEYKLHPILGTGLFIVDILPKRIINPYIRKLSNKYRQIYISGEVRDKSVLYVAEKVCESLVCIIFVLGFVLLYLLKNSGDNSVSQIKRPSEDMFESKYNLTAQLGDSEDVNLVIAPKEYSKEEAYKVFAKRKDECIKHMLKDNESVDDIRSNINLEGMEYNDGVVACWNVQGDSIDVDGSINRDGDVVSCDLILTMSYKEWKKEYKVPLAITGSKESLQSVIQKYIDDQDKTNAYVTLPEEIGDEKISFKEEESPVWIIVLIGGVIYAFAMFFIRDLEIKDKLRDRHEEMISDYPELLNKFVLLLRAGLGNVKALERIVLEYEKQGNYRYAYEEIKYMLDRIRLGEGEEKAYENYAKRCNEICYSKFAGMLSENLKRGNLNMKESLNDELNRAWKERENILRIKGERVGTKLVNPMILILIVTLVMIIVPAFMSMKGV